MKKGEKKDKKTVFKILEVFFFFNLKKSENILFCFFFSGKVYTSLTHSFSEGGEKKACEKENTIFTHSLEFCRKVVKNKLFQGNKKNGTFA